MGIPKEILAVERPKNTVVKFASNFYYVVKRTCVYKDGRNVPKDIGIIGKIIDGKYVPNNNVITKDTKEIDILNYGKSALAWKCSSSILKDLQEVYSEVDAKKLYIIALLRTINHKLTNRDLKFEYDNDYISVTLPQVGLSESLMPEFLESIGASTLKIEEFMRNRVSAYSKDVVVVDGTLKGYNSKSSSLSDWSRKGKVKGSKDFSIIYSYDIQTKEPIASQIYTGNMLDSTSFIDFISHYNSNKEIIILDKGFWTNDCINKIKENNNLKYIVPIKQNSKVISMNNLFDDLKLVDNTTDTILGKKVSTNNKIYYIFKNMTDAHAQENGYLKTTYKKNNFDNLKYEKKKKQFGTIIFESNCDMDLIDIYTSYKERWNIEVMFQFYKNILDIEPTRVQSDNRVRATEFINYLSLIIGCKIKKYLDVKKITPKHSYNQTMNYLNKCMKCRVFDKRQKWADNQMILYVKEIVKKLGI